MKIKIIMMFKDEDDLLRPWIRYHSALVGSENLIIFDNGSTSARVKEIIKEASRSDGVNIVTTHSSTEDFVTRGSLYAKIIQQMDNESPADFYFPLDCDEFLAASDGTDVSLSRESIVDELKRFISCESPLMIQAGLDNNPNDPGWFRWAHNQRKTFFARNSCKWMDHGFHSGTTKNGAPGLRTGIVYIHFHYKPYPIFIEHSRAKLRPFLNDFSEPNLVRYISEKKSAHHCARYLLTSEADYMKMFDKTAYIHVPEVERALLQVGERLPFSVEVQRG